MPVDEHLKKLDFLDEEIRRQLDRLHSRRERDKRRDLAIKITSIGLSAFITILLGLQVDSTWSAIFRNTALVFGATVTILNALEAIGNHRSLWVRRTVSIASLYALQRDVACLRLDILHDESRISSIDECVGRLNSILEEDLKAWIALRGDNVQKTEQTIFIPQR